MKYRPKGLINEELRISNLFYYQYTEQCPPLGVCGLSGVSCQSCGRKRCLLSPFCVWRRKQKNCVKIGQHGSKWKKNHNQ